MSEYSQVDVSVVLIERSGLLLAEANQKWGSFSLPQARLRRRPGPGVGERKAPLDAAVRAAARALGRPLPSTGLPQPVPLDEASATWIRSGRDHRVKRYR